MLQCELELTKQDDDTYMIMPWLEKKGCMLFNPIKTWLRVYEWTHNNNIMGMTRPINSLSLSTYLCEYKMCVCVCDHIWLFSIISVRFFIYSIVEHWIPMERKKIVCEDNKMWKLCKCFQNNYNYLYFHSLSCAMLYFTKKN